MCCISPSPRLPRAQIRDSGLPFAIVVNLIVPGTPLLGVVATFASEQVGPLMRIGWSAGTRAFGWLGWLTSGM